MKKIAFTLLALTLLPMLVFPTAVMAWSHWDLEGWRIDAGKWMDGLLFTWYEDDEVPYRLAVRGYDGIDANITIQHDFKDADGHIGIDYVVLSGPGEPFIGPRTNRTTDPGSIPSPHFTTASGYFTINGPNLVEVPNGYIQEWVFQLTPAGQTDLQEFNSGNWAIYWNAHLAVTAPSPPPYGSSYWNGASLHAHTSVTGSQDVPIKTPPQEGPPPEPSIDIIKSLSVTGEEGPWLDANNYVDVSEYCDMYFKIVVENTGNVELTGIEIEDWFANQHYEDDPTPISLDELDLGSYDSTLGPGEQIVIIYGPFTAGYCYHSNKASVSAVFDSDTLTDEDFAKYKGWDWPCPSP